MEEPTKTEVKKRTIPEMSADTLTVYNRIINLEVDGFLPYGEMSALIGRSIQARRHTLHSAMRKALRDHDMVFGAVRGEGIKRLNDSGVIDKATEARRSSGRKARRAMTQLKVINYPALPPVERTRALTENACLGAMAHVSHGATVEKVREIANSSNLPLPIGRVLEAMKGEG